jgi:hypothetical protein
LSVSLQQLNEITGSGEFPTDNQFQIDQTSTYSVVTDRRK